MICFLLLVNSKSCYTYECIACKIALSVHSDIGAMTILIVIGDNKNEFGMLQALPLYLQKY